MFVRHSLVKIPDFVCRQLHTTSGLNFKFKFTEEMAREQEKKMQDQELLEASKKPNLAIHTKESSLIMGRVSHDRYKNVVKIGVPKHTLYEHYLLYIREQDNIYALDKDNISSPGDWVLLRKDDDIPDIKVSHIVEKVIYKCGNWIDPLTNRRSFGIHYDDEFRELEKIKIEL